MSSITIMTTQGRAQLAAAVANAQSFPSAKVVVGDGNGATYVPNEAQVGLVHEVWRGNATVARTDDRVIFQAVVPAEVGGFTVREVGVLIGEVGAEQLFIISQHPSTEKIAAPANGSGPLPITIAFSASAAEQAVLPIGSSDNATLQLSRAPHITVDGLVTEPPAEPADGSLYAIDAGAAGLFVGKGGWLVERVAGAWIYKQPPEKSVIRLAANGAWYQRDGADWAALTFEDTSILWAQIQETPAEFPPEPHNHDDRYFTEAETAVLLAGKSNTDHLHDDRYLRLIGGTATGGIAAPDLAAVAAGLRLWLRNVGAFNRIDSYNDPITATQNLLINSSLLAFLIGDVEKMRLDGLGRLGIGTDAAEALLDVAGGAIVRSDLRLKAAAYPKLLFEATGNPSGDRKWQIYDGPGGILRFGHLNDAENAETPGTMSFDGALQVSASIGSAAHVLAGGANVAWKSLAELGVGKKIIAIGTANSGNTINFATAEPDTSYSGIVWNGVLSDSASNASTLGVGSISSKGTGSCVVNLGNTLGPPGMTGTNPVFYIIYR
ncbi:MAG TPA: phage tail protein [Rhabdaerophilum sp.]|nr:phage tail protein [Rhabdaerophilum sp.]